MQVYQAPLDEIRFLLQTFGYDEDVASLPGYEDYDLETAMVLFEEYARFCVGELLPLNQKADRQGLRFDPATGAVTTPDGFPAAYKAYTEGGFSAMSLAVEYGGAGAPHSLSVMASEILIATAKSFSMCPGLTLGLIESLEAHGSDALKEYYLPHLVSGDWSGTMCLTEPQCGTDLGLLSTKAEPHEDHFLLTGTKTWITFGEHDLTDNIVHLVLARLPDAPPGIRGISTFVVPKLNPDGSKNGVSCGGLEHKLGIHASPTCVINLDGAHGWLVGDPNKGMRSMFTMMNAARLNVGIEGVALAHAAYQSAVAFAKDRRQGKSLNPARQEEGADADNILVHPDVRRMLLNIKSTNEALRGLVALLAVNIDISHHHADETRRKQADDLVALLTPVVKSYGTERGFANISEAMQVMAGAGYTQDWPVEQHLRDCRIAMIYEGTNHIQALDLVGRKLPMGNGRLVRAFFEEVGAFAAAAANEPELAEFAGPLGKELGRLMKSTGDLAVRGMQDPEEAGAAASNYLNQFALVTLAWIWGRMVKAALPLEGAERESRIQTARYFYAMILPEAALFAKLAAVGKAPMMDFDPSLF